MRWGHVLTTVVAGIALTGCGSGQSTMTAGTPKAAATPVSSTSSTTTTPTLQVATPRNIAGVDPCTLLLPEDFTGMGPFAEPPRPHPETPNACLLRVGDGDEHDLFLNVELGEGYRKFRADNPSGFERITVAAHAS
jgi:hypothetical protein